MALRHRADESRSAQQVIDAAHPGQCLHALRQVHQPYRPPTRGRVSHHRQQAGQPGTIAMRHAGQIEHRHRSRRQCRLQRLLRQLRQVGVVELVEDRLQRRSANVSGVAAANWKAIGAAPVFT